MFLSLPDIKYLIPSNDHLLQEFKFWCTKNKRKEYKPA